MNNPKADNQGAAPENSELFIRIMGDVHGQAYISRVRAFIKNISTFTDENAQQLLDEAVHAAALNSPEHEGIEITSAEFVPKSEVLFPIVDGDSVKPWTTMDFALYDMVLVSDSSGNRHPRLVLVGLMRVLCDRDPMLLSLNERELIRSEALLVSSMSLHTPIHSIAQITPDMFWSSMQDIAAMPAERRPHVLLVSRDNLRESCRKIRAENYSKSDGENS